MKLLKFFIITGTLLFSCAGFSKVSYEICEASYDMCPQEKASTCQEYYSCLETEISQINPLIIHGIKNTKFDKVKSCTSKRATLEAMYEAHTTTIECFRNEKTGKLEFGG